MAFTVGCYIQLSKENKAVLELTLSNIECIIIKSCLCSRILMACRIISWLFDGEKGAVILRIFPDEFFVH